MGGAVTGKGNITHAAEFNIWADPEASNIVLDTFPKIEIIDWELSTSDAHSLTEDFLSRYKNCTETVKGKFVHSVTTAKGMLYFADALAMAVAICPSIVLRSTDRDCYLELFGVHSRGMMIVNWQMSNLEHVRGERKLNVRIVQELNMEKVYELMLAGVS
jgi:purine nucleosidase